MSRSTFALRASRDTAVVVAELFKSVKRSVLVSTLVIRQPETVFGALADRMVEVPGLKVQIFAHVGRDVNADTARLLCYKDLFLRNQVKEKGQAA